jgi:thiol-disulfide isomerase/thioredoxin
LFNFKIKNEKIVAFISRFPYVFLFQFKTGKTAFLKALSETLLTPDGSQVAFQDILKKHEGKTVVIEMWASWCKDCKNNAKNKERSSK